MRNIQANALRSATNTRFFIDEHAAKLGVIKETGVYQELGESIVALSGHAADQSNHGLAIKETLRTQATRKRELLRGHMAPIARIARLQLPHTPELHPLRMPKAAISIARLSIAAKAMANSAARYTEVFVAAGLPQDFVARLEEASDALLASLHSRDQSRGKVTAATTGLRERSSRVRKIIAVLDAFIQNVAADDAPLLRNWLQITHVQKIGVRTANPVEPPAAGVPTLLVSTSETTPAIPSQIATAA